MNIIMILEVMNMAELKGSKTEQNLHLLRIQGEEGGL